MNEKILIAYATKCGSTAEIGEAIAAELARLGQNVNLRQVQNVLSLDGYTRVVIGSAVRMGAWLPEAVRFVEQFKPALMNVPLFFFSVHMLNLGADEASRAARLAYTAPLRQLVLPHEEVFFAEKIELAKMNFVDRLLSKAMHAADQDLRNWDAIRAWAQSLAA